MTSCPILDQYLAQEYGRNEAIEFRGGKNKQIINIFIWIPFFGNQLLLYPVTMNLFPSGRFAHAALTPNRSIHAPNEIIRQGRNEKSLRPEIMSFRMSIDRSVKMPSDRSTALLSAARNFSGDW